MDTNGLKVLVVDDNQDNLVVLKAVLADTFPEAAVQTALNGLSGLAKARAEDPDVILLDIVMPEMDGLEVCRRLKNDQELRNIPVVFLTSLRSDRESRIAALEAGGEAFLCKPIDETELSAQIRAMAKIKAANQRERREKERLTTLVAERTRELEMELAERRQAEEKLEKTQGELLHASRLAGMAEVATNVLHNVGNVLSSINVSTSLVSDQVKQSKLANLSRAADLMRQHADDLGAFLTRDPKGRQLPLYIEQLTDYLLEEQAALLKELGCLRTSVEHIRDIVAMQQRYANISGAVEVVKTAELVEDALRMNRSSLERHDVQVIRDYDPDHLPEISVAKHKVLQILVNLIGNAKYACHESGRPDKRLTLRVTNGCDLVRISVVDNGVGIPPTNLSRIFTHGFTTRKDGHGFGLHSSMLAAKELGAALRVQSDGPGKGATFTLELPFAGQSAHKA